MTIARILSMMALSVVLLCGCEEKAPPNPAPTADADVVKVECLPCGGHKIKLTENTVRTEYQGETYYFCAEGCKEKFLAEPTKFVKTPATQPSTQPD